MMTFTVVTGKERYEIVDVETKGTNWAETKKEMLHYVYYLGVRLGHTVTVHDRQENCWTTFTPAGA